MAFHNSVLYALTGYPSSPLMVFKLDPVTGTVMGGAISIAGPASPNSDAFAVLPNGNFLINDFDGGLGATIYREYNGTTGALVPGGLVVDLATFGFTARGNGVDPAPDGQSLYFMANATTLVQTDLTGALMGFQNIGGPIAVEDIAVVVP